MGKVGSAGGARAGDVLQLADLIRDEVRKRTGILLELDMKVVGEEAPSPV